MNGSPPSPSAGAPLWTDGKAPDALRTIGEVGQALGIRQHVLRYWEDQFPMLSPLKRSGGRRYYRPADVALVRRIDQLVHREGYTLRGARGVLEAEGRRGPMRGAAAPGTGEGPPVAGANPAPAPVSPDQHAIISIGTGRPPVTELGLRLRRIRARLAAALED